MSQAKGTVFTDGEARVDSAVVVARRNGQVEYTATNDDGDFTFTNLAPGTWTLTAFHEKRPSGQPRQIDVTTDQAGVRLDMRRPLTDKDFTRGAWTLGILVAGFLALIVVYTTLHIAYPGSQLPLGSAVVNLVDQTSQSVSATSSPATNQQVMSQVAELRAALTAALSANPGTVSAADARVLMDLQTGIEQDLQNNRQAEALTGFNTLRGLLTQATPGNFLWTVPPWKYLEALSWGLAGVLVYLIITVATYIRWNRFYAEGIALDIAQVVTLPIMALVVVLLLATASINLTVSGNQLQLSLQDPQIMVIVAFLVALQPWDTLRMLRAAARSITGESQATAQ